VTPAERGLIGLTLVDPGQVRQVRGIALASRLAERRVSERMAATCEAALGAANLACDIKRMDDMEARHPGANLTIWAESSSGCRFGADRAGSYGRTSEAIGQFVARTFLTDLRSGATVDRHLADQLVLFAAGARPFRLYRPTSDGSRPLERVARESVRGDAEYGWQVSGGRRYQTSKGVWCPERRLDGDKSWHETASDKIGQAASIGTMLAVRSRHGAEKDESRTRDGGSSSFVDVGRRRPAEQGTQTGRRRKRSCRFR
jgi:hypothetical protein